MYFLLNYLSRYRQRPVDIYRQKYGQPQYRGYSDLSHSSSRGKSFSDSHNYQSVDGSSYYKYDVYVSLMSRFSL